MSERRGSLHTLLSVVIGALICLATLMVVAICRMSMVTATAHLNGEKPVERERIAPDQQIHTAHHEAGHAVVSAALFPERAIIKLEVFSKVSQGKFLGLTSWGAGELGGDDAYRHRANALISLAGGAAEDVLFKKTPSETDPDADSSAFASLAYCEAAKCACPPDSKVGEQCLLNGFLKPQREELYAQTKTCVEANRGVIIELANAVILKQENARDAVRTLSEDELKTFFATHTLDVDACKLALLP